MSKIRRLNIVLIIRCRKSGGNLQTIHIKTAKFEAFLFDFTVYPFILLLILTIISNTILP
jgi:hypothetical protein